MLGRLAHTEMEEKSRTVSKGNFLYMAGLHRQLPRCCQHPRVTIGRRARGNFHPDIAVAVRAVVDDHLLAQSFSQLRRPDSRQQVGRPAGCDRGRSCGCCARERSLPDRPDERAAPRKGATVATGNVFLKNALCQPSCKGHL